MKGELVLAANSIGCDADIPVRTLEMIKAADLLVFEEDRPARKLLKAASIHREYLKHNEHNDSFAKQEILKTLQDGKRVVYVSDQGSSSVADPGRELVKLAYQCGATVKVIPGPSSVTSAISACPFDCSSFDFVGFLPRDEAGRINLINELKLRKHPQVILDAPYRLTSLLKSCAAAFGNQRQSFLALDISGEDESYYLGSLKDLIEKVTKLDKKLNFVLIVATSS